MPTFAQPLPSLKAVYFRGLLILISLCQYSVTTSMAAAQPPHAAAKKNRIHMSYGEPTHSAYQHFAPSRHGLPSEHSRRHHSDYPFSPVFVIPFDMGMWRSPFSGYGSDPIFQEHEAWRNDFVPPAYGNPLEPGYGQMDFGHHWPSDQFQPYAHSLPTMGWHSLSANSDRAIRSETENTPYPVIITKAIARSAQRRAEAAFRAGEYNLAASLSRQVVTLDSDNGTAYLFSSHTNFAIGNYDAAANDLRAAIHLLPSDQWNYVVRNYRLFYGQNDYVRQMDRLEQFLNDRPVYVPARIVRGHQWVSLGYAQEAREDLMIVISYRPQDETAKKMLDDFEERSQIKSGPYQLAKPIPSLNSSPPRMLERTGKTTTLSEQRTIEGEQLPAPDGWGEEEALDDFQLPHREDSSELKSDAADDKN